MIAFLPTLGFQEMLVLLVLGIVLFGRNLPNVGRTLGRTVAQLRRGMQEFKDQMDRDESVRQVRDSMRETRSEIARAGALPKAIANPRAALGNIARDALAGTVDAEAAKAGEQGAGPKPGAGDPTPPG